MTIFVLITAAFGFCVGIAVLWANPTRFANQMFSMISLLMLLSLLVLYAAVHARNLYEVDNSTNPVPWVRIGGALSGLFPWALWLLKESLLVAENERLSTFRRSLPWLAMGLLLAAVCFTGWYIPADSTPYQQKRGDGFTFRGVTLIITFLVLLLRAWLQMKTQCGIRRVEMQFFVLNLGIATLFSVSLAFLSAVLQIPSFRILSIVVIFSAYLLSAWAVAFYQVFDLRQVLYALTQRIGILIFLAVGIFYTAPAFEAFLPKGSALVLTSTVYGALAFWLDGKSKTWLDLGGQRLLADARREAIEIALIEPSREKLILAFTSFLAQRWHISFGALLLDDGETFQAQNLTIGKKTPAYVGLCETGWATPESLERRRKTESSEDLRRFIKENRIRLMIASPAGSQTPSLLIALGEKTNSWPFTYPEVQSLQNVGELIDSILTRSRLTSQAALQARIEHLAMMSRGLAHDLKNLITPVSSFLIHTDSHFQANSPEADVHSAARRSVRIMTDYIREALFFSERLEPRFEPVDVAKLFSNVAEITTARAADRQISVAFRTDDQVALCADAVLLQRVLANLVNNAIDASLVGGTVEVLAVPLGRAHVRFEVRDVGRGISRENLSRIFDPYFTTKEFGDEIRGFGLGLTICQKIVQLHAGTISVESELSQGTTVSIDLPAVPPKPRTDETNRLTRAAPFATGDAGGKT